MIVLTCIFLLMFAYACYDSSDLPERRAAKSKQKRLQQRQEELGYPLDAVEETWPPMASFGTNPDKMWKFYEDCFYHGPKRYSYGDIESVERRNSSPLSSGTILIYIYRDKVLPSFTNPVYTKLLTLSFSHSDCDVADDVFQMLKTGTISAELLNRTYEKTNGRFFEYADKGIYLDDDFFPSGNSSHSYSGPADRDFQKALTQARIYADENFLSRATIRKKLMDSENPYFPPEAVAYAMQHIDRDFCQIALRNARMYAHNEHLSKSRVYKKLSTPETGFTATEIQYAMHYLDVDFKEIALLRAKDYYGKRTTSKRKIMRLLTAVKGDDFTGEEARYAIYHLPDKVKASKSVSENTKSETSVHSTSENIITESVINWDNVPEREPASGPFPWKDYLIFCLVFIAWFAGMFYTGQMQDQTSLLFGVLFVLILFGGIVGLIVFGVKATKALMEWSQASLAMAFLCFGLAAILDYVGVQFQSRAVGATMSDPSYVISLFLVIPAMLLVLLSLMLFAVCGMHFLRGDKKPKKSKKNKKTDSSDSNQTME